MSSYESWWQIMTALLTSIARSDLLPLSLLLQLLLFIFGEILPLAQEQLCELFAPPLPPLLY